MLRSRNVTAENDHSPLIDDPLTKLIVYTQSPRDMLEGGLELQRGRAHQCDVTTPLVRLAAPKAYEQLRRQPMTSSRLSQ